MKELQLNSMKGTISKIYPHWYIIIIHSDKITKTDFLQIEIYNGENSMLTSFLSEYPAQLFNVTIRVCCSTKYRKHNCVLQPEKLKGAFQGRNCVIYKYRAIEKNVNQGYLETKYNYWYIYFHFSTRKNSFCTKSISKTDYLSIS